MTLTNKESCIDYSGNGNYSDVSVEPSSMHFLSRRVFTSFKFENASVIEKHPLVIELLLLTKGREEKHTQTSGEATLEQIRSQEEELERNQERLR